MMMIRKVHRLFTFPSLWLVLHAIFSLHILPSTTDAFSTQPLLLLHYHHNYGHQYNYDPRRRQRHSHCTTKNLPRRQRQRQQQHPHALYLKPQPRTPVFELYYDNEEEALAKREYDNSLFLIAAVPPVLAFILWGDVARAVAYLIDQLGFYGRNVDGNAFANNLLRPTINGVVVPAAGVGLGTLFATTVNVLWNRQLMLRTSINQEVCELRHLRRALFGCFGTAQHSKRRATALGLLHSYTQTVISETKPDCIEALEEMQMMQQGISLNELDDLAEMLHGVDGAAVARPASVHKAQDLLVSLNNHRSGRVATTLSGFPLIHWSVLTALYSIIVMAFLIDSNQEVNQYLNSIQLRLLFATITMVGSGAAMLLRDLEDPFQGSFCINMSAKQLNAFEELLLADIQDAQQQHAQVGPSAVQSLDRTRPRPNYNTGNTLYLHLLTGPLGHQTRMVGDLVAWMYRKLNRAWTKFKVKAANWKKRRANTNNEKKNNTANA